MCHWSKSCRHLSSGPGWCCMGTNVWHPAEFHRKIAEFGLTVLNLPTAYWQELAREWADVPELVPNIQPRLFIVGGDVMSPDALELWQQTPVNSIRLLNAYGPTETTITATAFEITPRLGENTTIQRVPIGRPLANREIYILDRYGNPVPIGVPGDLHIGGAGLARGYLNRPDLTAEKFIPNPFSSRARRTTVQDRRPGPLSARWEHRVSRPCRPSGEDPRVSHRTGRNRSGAWPTPGRAGGGRPGPGRRARREAVGGLCGR